MRARVVPHGRPVPGRASALPETTTEARTSNRWIYAQNHSVSSQHNPKNYARFGFLYRLPDEPRIVHLERHNKLTKEAPTNEYFWLQSGLDEVVRNVIAPAITEVGQDRKLPYSPLYEGRLGFELLPQLRLFEN
jgi:hypothetical protein